MALFLRRRKGEKIYIFDNRTEVVLEVLDLDLDSGAITIRLNDEEPREVFPPEEITIMQGDGSLKITPVVEMDPESASFTKIGVTAPRSMNIMRGELVRGMTREDRAKIVRSGSWVACGATTPETPEGKYLVQRRDGSIPNWPWFVLGARDPAAPAALFAYADAAEEAGMNPQYVHDIRQMAEQWEEYQIATGDVGDPDAPYTVSLRPINGPIG